MEIMNRLNMIRMSRPYLRILPRISRTRGGVFQKNSLSLPLSQLSATSSLMFMSQKIYCCRSYGCISSFRNHHGKGLPTVDHIRPGVGNPPQTRATMVTMNKVDFVPKKNRPVVGSWQTTSEDELYDVVIVGGGMAGQAMACALGFESSLGDHRILLLEQGKKPLQLNELPSKYSNRVCALNHNSVKLLSDHHIRRLPDFLLLRLRLVPVAWYLATFRNIILLGRGSRL